MMRDFLMDVFTKWHTQDIFLFILLISAFFLSWLTILSLGLKILKVKIKLKQIIPGVLIGTLTALFLKPYIPGIGTLFITLLPLLLCIKIYGKTKWVIASWVTILLLLSTAIGPLLIITPLANSNPSLASFFLANRFGMIAGSLLETLGAAILLMFLNIFNISLIPNPGQALTSVQFIDIVIYLVMLFFSYDGFMRIWQNIQKASVLFLIRPYAVFFLAAGGVVAYYLHKVNDQKKIDNMKLEREKAQLEHEKEKEELQVKIQEMNELYQRLKDEKLDPQEFDKLSKQLLLYSEAIINLPPQPPPQIDMKKKFEADLFKISFTDREQDVIRCIAEGLDNPSIADELHLGIKYVGNLVGFIKAKIEVKMESKIDDRLLVIYAITWSAIHKINKPEE